jgi:hypothetical protein
MESLFIEAIRRNNVKESFRLLELVDLHKPFDMSKLRTCWDVVLGSKVPESVGTAAMFTLFDPSVGWGRNAGNVRASSMKLAVKMINRGVRLEKIYYNEPGYSSVIKEINDWLNYDDSYLPIVDLNDREILSKNGYSWKSRSNTEISSLYCSNYFFLYNN